MDWDALVFQHDNKKLTRRVVEFISDSFPSGRIGARLYRHFKDFGFKDVKIKPYSYMHHFELVKRIVEGITLTGVANNLTVLIILSLV